MAKILVVDDDQSIVTILQHILARDNHKVSVAYNGKDGLASARADRPDLIILDIMMPVMDGITASGILFQDPAMRQIPVLILTAKANARQMLELVPNVRLYMEKPFEAAELLNSVNRLLGVPSGHYK